MNKYLNLLIFLAVPIDIVPLFFNKQRRSIFAYILLIIISLAAAIIAVMDAKPISIASIIAKIFSPIVKSS